MASDDHHHPAAADGVRRKDPDGSDLDPAAPATTGQANAATTSRHAGRHRRAAHDADGRPARRAAGPHVRPAFLWIPLSRASQDGEDGEKPRRRPAGQASPGGAMDGGEEGERRRRLEGRRLGFSPRVARGGDARGEGQHSSRRE